MKEKKKLSIVFTAHNEGEIIKKVITDYYNEISKKIPCEVIVAEDGSTDNTKEVLLSLRKKFPLKLVMSNKKKGYQKASIDVLKVPKTNLIFFVDGDYQYNPKDFWKLYRKIKKYDIIIGHKIARKDPFYRNFLSWGFNLLVRQMFKLPLHDTNTGYRLIRKKLIKDVLKDIKYLKYGFTAELIIRSYYKKYKIAEIPITHNPRTVGVTGMYPIRKLPRIVIHQILDLIKLRKEIFG